VGALELDLPGQVEGTGVELIDVEDDQLGVEAREESQGLRTGSGLEHRVAGLLDHPDDAGAAVRLAIDDEHRSRGHRIALRSGPAAVNQALDEVHAGPDTGTRRNP